MQKSFDVIIVGAGVAGCHLAALLAEKGISVMILEKNRGIKKDSGIVSKKIDKYVKLSDDIIREKITKMKFVSPSGKSFFISSNEPFAYLLDREKFGMHMRKLATDRGAKIIYEECKIIDMSKKFVEVSTGNTYYSKIIIGCDGANSLVRKTMGGRAPKFFHGVLTNGSFLARRDDIEIHFNKFYSPHFFGWIIPRTGELGVICKKEPAEYLRYFQRNVGFSENDLFHSPIPVGPVKSYFDRCLLVGDSCGQVKPSTGGGIMYSIICAEHASKIICEAFEKRDFSESFMKRYEKAWKTELGKDIWFQLFLRNIYRKMTNVEIEHFFDWFGSDFQNINSFDYDKLSTVIWKLPKSKLIVYAIISIPMLIEWSYE